MMDANKIILVALVVITAVSGLPGCEDLVNNFSEEELKEAAVTIGGESCIHTVTPSPLIVINGELAHQVSLKDLDPAFIQSISVLKGDEALKLFGSAAKEGVIKIETDQKLFADSKPK